MIEVRTRHDTDASVLDIWDESDVTTETYIDIAIDKEREIYVSMKDDIGKVIEVADCNFFTVTYAMFSNDHPEQEASVTAWREL